ncbi:MAG: isoprenylcysteine carboxylmethyltransferase family protein, partial [Eubacteriaceae bacterium]|nr:isoprenylcysteine carboxylmethyltransferase family protein [Eubacteriaceae bacterium]
MDDEMIFRIIFWILLLIIFIFNRLIPTIRAKKTGGKFMPDQEAVENEGLAYLMLRILLFIPFVAFLVVYWINPQWMKIFHFDLLIYFRWIGVLIAVIGVFIWLYSQGILGRYWSPQLQIQSEHKLVTSGPYIWVRHPIYAGSIIWAWGLALFTSNTIFFLVAALITIGANLRALKEEKMLIRHFGKVYLSYMEQTGRFIPKIKKLSSLVKFSYFGLTTVLFKRKTPLVGSIIITDKCNLSCKHCSVSNIQAVLYPYSRIKADMKKMHEEGVRVLLF